MLSLKTKSDPPPPSADESPALVDDDYWTSSRRPLSCLIFLLPLLGLYEIGVLWLGGSEPASYRNGADHWMRAALQEIGLVQVHVLPALVIGLLLAWHLGGRYSWKVDRETLLGMLAESLLFALTLVVMGQVQNLAFAETNDASMPVSNALGASGLSKVVSYVGAGL